MEIFAEDAGGPVWLLLGGLVCWFYWLACVRRFHTILNETPRLGRAELSIGPNQAVRSHFIPFYNLYWLFKWPMEMSKYLTGHTSVKIIPGEVLGTFLLLTLFARFLDSFLGFCLLFGIGSYISGRIGEAVRETRTGPGVRRHLLVAGASFPGKEAPVTASHSSLRSSGTGASKARRLTRRRMAEGEPPGVEGRAGEVPQDRLEGAGERLPARLAVDRIAHQRMAEVLQVDADLVRPAGREIHLQRARSRPPAATVR